MRQQRRQRTSATSRDRDSHRCAALTIAPVTLIRDLVRAPLWRCRTWSSSQAGVNRVEERAVSRVLPARPHLARRISDRDAGLGVAAAKRAAGAEVAEAALSVAHRPFRLGELEAEAEP